MSKTVIDRFKQRHGVGPSSPANIDTNDVTTPVNRNNYLILANTVELTTEIVMGVIGDDCGMSDTIGDSKMIRRDVSDMVASKLVSQIEKTAGAQ